MEPITVSAKTLGKMGLREFCPRCFWIQAKAKLPWQIFPGIFSSIDGYTKKITSGYHATHNAPPPWLAAAWPELTLEPEKAPDWRTFTVDHPSIGVTLRGGPDEMWGAGGKALVILDDKTAKHTVNQDSLHGMYDIQVNSYAYIAERLHGRVIKGLALVYYEPQTDIDADEVDDHLTPAAIHRDNGTAPDGFLMPFKPLVKKIGIDTAKIPKLLERVAEICGSERPPQGAAACKDCVNLEAIRQLLK